MEVIDAKYFPYTDNIIQNESKSKSHSYISDDNEKDACGPHSHMVNLFKKLIELGI